MKTSRRTSRLVWCTASQIVEKFRSNSSKYRREATLARMISSASRTSIIARKAAPSRRACVVVPKASIYPRRLGAPSHGRGGGPGSGGEGRGQGGRQVWGGGGGGVDAARTRNP